MGYMAHHGVIVTIAGYVSSRSSTGTGSAIAAASTRTTRQMPDLEGFRESLPDHWRRLLVGPIPSMANDYWTVFFAPDGSKEGWDTSDTGDAYRAALIELFSGAYEDGSSPFDVVQVRFGGDDPELAEVQPFRAPAKLGWQ